MGSKLVKNIFHVSFHRLFGNHELCGDLLVGVTQSHSSQDLDLAFGERHIADMLSYFSSDLRGNVTSSRVHRPNRIRQLLSDRALQHVPDRTSPQARRACTSPL